MEVLRREPPWLAESKSDATDEQKGAAANEAPPGRSSDGARGHGALGFEDREDLYQFFKRYDVRSKYTIEDLERDRATLATILNK